MSEDYKKLFEMKQDDWFLACKEIDGLNQKISELQAELKKITEWEEKLAEEKEWHDEKMHRVKLLEAELKEARAQALADRSNLMISKRDNLAQSKTIERLREASENLLDSIDPKTFPVRKWRDLKHFKPLGSKTMPSDEAIAGLLEALSASEPVQDDVFRKALDQTIKDCDHILKRPEMDDEKPPQEESRA